MSGNVFLRTSVLLLIVGMVVGMVMGMRHDFTYAPAHAHLNLVGGVLMFLAGLFYNSRPGTPRGLVATHYWVALIGVLLIVPGIAGMQTQEKWAPAVVGIGSVLTFVQMLIFAYAVWRGEKKAAA